jgi:predicted transcriptional regulator YheO
MVRRAAGRGSRREGGQKPAFPQASYKIPLFFVIGLSYIGYEMDIMDIGAQVVEFLGKACGDNCEVVLQDLREGKMCIVAIANGHISGRSVGAPPTDLALRLIAQGSWKTSDYVCNYEGKTKDNRSLRSSTFFIKNEGKLLGMLCVNVDTSKYTQLSENILRLAGLSSQTIQQAAEPQTENFYENMEESIKSVLRELTVPESSKGRLSQNERLTIIERLMDRGIFLLRGSVSSVAEKLQCSEASMYRYIAMVNKRKTRSSAPKSPGLKKGGPGDEPLIYGLASNC